ncbi:von Willebrand factor type A domain-containing protein [Actinotalea ferrariae]|uniref:vWA domain-containing protein n=1 Tax=Actinotalea ferrariae TaxID=1386098 RepID=UPI001C8BCC99|nr:von Willebrand factor type A domain-containing protein [Actinotalea ferrariae]MBX9243479.1 von Willebrand factor type A domain-containing protein [Actinotalea ferrariae]
MSTIHGRTTGLAAAALAVALGLTACSDGSGGASESEWDGSGDVQPGPEVVEEPGVDREPGELTSDTRLTDPAQDALSTFALDIDTGSYSRFRDTVMNEGYVDPSEVRTEEFINYFAQDYPTPEQGLGVSIDATVLPFEPEHRLVRVGVASAPTSDSARDDVDLVLVVDCSGSMGEAGKMETTKSALRTLVTSLRSTDRVAMVCYSTEARVVLEPTPLSERDGVLTAVDGLEPFESTNAAAGLALGYDLAMSMRTEGRMTRVVLISDGVANVGETDPDGILSRISTEAKAGINLISVGVGITTYNDHLLEQLADQGDGWHVYVDSDAEAERVFATGLTGSLVVAATDARAQVEFDPEQVSGYRLIGYENRAMADDDFRNDAVDAGEVFAGHTTTALYEVALRDGSSEEPFVRATVRYLDDAGEAVERSASLVGSETAASPREASPRLRQDLVIALLTDRLLDGPWSEIVSDADLRAEAEALPRALDWDDDVTQLVDLVHRATTY